jgi:kumamolisin
MTNRTKKAKKTSTAKTSARVSRSGAAKTEQSLIPHFASQNRAALSGSAKRAVVQMDEKRPAAQAEQMAVSVIVRRKIQLSAAHVSGRQRLTRARFNADHAADPAAVALVKRFAAEFGLKVQPGTPVPGRRTVKLTGTIANMQRAFGVTLAHATIEGQTYRVREGSIYLPAELQGYVVAVLGLDNRPQARPHFRVLGGAGTAVEAAQSKGFARPHVGGSSFTPVEVGQLYQFPQGVTASNQTIGIIELGGGYREADLSAYFKSLGQKPPKVIAVPVGSGKNHPTRDPQGPDGEVMLDIEVAGAVAPGARIVVYFAPNTDQGFLDAIAHAIHDTKYKPSVISISWGSAEVNWTAQAMTALDEACQSAVALGVTITAAAGDNGSSDGIKDGKNHVVFPASSPHVLACGGTTLHSGSPVISSEVVWGATGGGVSNFFPLPAWQAASNVPKSNVATGGRGVPDVAGNADPQTGYAIRVDGQRLVFGGTGAAASLWAGLIAVANQHNGRASGFIQPALYAARNKGALRDTAQGDNGSFKAGPGWDACTGLGSPIAPLVISAIKSNGNGDSVHDTVASKEKSAKSEAPLRPKRSPASQSPGFDVSLKNLVPGRVKPIMVEVEAIRPALSPEEHGLHGVGKRRSSRGPALITSRSPRKEKSTAKPTSSVVHRIPHMDISQTRLQPEMTFEVSIFADQFAARSGETSADIVVESGAVLEVQLVVSAHFFVSGPAATRMTIAGAKRSDAEQLFKVSVRPRKELPAGIVPSLIALFFHNGRPCGSVARTVEIDGVAMQHLDPRPGRIQTDDGVPADLTVVVTRAVINDGRQFLCAVRSPLLKRYESAITEPWNLPQAADEMVLSYMEQFTAEAITSSMLLAELCGAGRNLFEAAPKAFRQVFWDLIDAGVNLQTIAIVTEEPSIPWELMIPHRVKDGRRQQRKALGTEFLVGRWPSPDSVSPLPHIDLVDSFVVAPVYDPPLAFALAEAAMVADSFKGEIIAPADFDSVTHNLGRVGKTIIHFVCHGEDEETQAEAIRDPGRRVRGRAQVIRLENGEKLNSTQIIGIDSLREIFERWHPLVFINACEVGRTTTALVGVGGFAKAFVDIGASAVIAPLWAVKDEIAHEVAKTFYERVKTEKNTPFAEIIRDLRRRAYEPGKAEDTFAAYCFYGDPAAV